MKTNLTFDELKKLRQLCLAVFLNRDLISLRYILTYSQMTTLGFASEEPSRNEGKSGWR